MRKENKVKLYKKAKNKFYQENGLHILTNEA